MRFHDWRHSYRTAMAAAGASLGVLQEWMGHRDYKTTSIYADYAPDPVAGSVLGRNGVRPGDGEYQR